MARPACSLQNLVLGASFLLLFAWATEAQHVKEVQTGGGAGASQRAEYQTWSKGTLKAPEGPLFLVPNDIAEVDTGNSTAIHDYGPHRLMLIPRIADLPAAVRIRITAADDATAVNYRGWKGAAQPMTESRLAGAPEGYYLVAFVGPPDESWLVQLSSFGATIVDVALPYGLVVHAEGRQMLGAALSITTSNGYSALRGIFPVPIEARLSGELLRTVLGQQSMGDIPGLRMDGKGSAVVRLFYYNDPAATQKPLDGRSARLAQTLKCVRAPDAELSYGFDDAALIGSPDELLRILQDIPDVAYVEAIHERQADEHAQVYYPVAMAVSPPLYTITPKVPEAGTSPSVMPEEEIPPWVNGKDKPGPSVGVAPGSSVLQSWMGAAKMPSSIANFEGLGDGASGFSVLAVPPDTEGDVGPNHYVQWVNSMFAIFDKQTGAVLYGPANGNTLFSSLGGRCASDNSGDPVVMYDRIADRWVMSQFAVDGTPYCQCIAVSQTNDPVTTSWNLYAFSYGTNFNDYGKGGVWPDGYYMMYHMFAGSPLSWLGTEVCAFDRVKMLAGQVATQQCFGPNSTYGGLLPSHLQGSTMPPAGSPNYFMAGGNNQLLFWPFHVDWAAPANTTFPFNTPTTLPVAAFTEPCCGVPQKDTSQILDSLGDRLMWRMNYRNFATHESLVFNHSVTGGAGTGMRWYEIRNPSTTPTVYQQGTFAPADTTWRWMGSVNMDMMGNIAAGYSGSSPTLNPSIYYSGRLANDPLGTFGQGEVTLYAGTGSQTTEGRWGDYSTMSVDPTDDCTFWFTSEYLTTDGAFNWHTRIGSFKFSDCGCAAPGAPTLITAAGASDGVDLAWTPGTGTTHAYNIYRSSNAACPVGTLTKVNAQPIASGTHTFTDTTATVGTTYTYVVRGSCDSGGWLESANSNCLASSPCNGVPTLDAQAYGCNQTVTVTVEDNTPLSTVYVYAWSTTDTLPVMVTLAEAPPGSDHYQGTFQVTTTAGPGKVLVSGEDVIEVRYVDPDFCGAPSQFTDVSATVDCQGPVISGVTVIGITGTRAVILWTTDEPADSHVQYTPPPASAGDSTSFKTSHSVVLSGLTPCTTYFFEVSSLDEWGNGTSDDNGGAGYTFTTTPDLMPVLTRTPGQAIPDNDPAGAWSALSVVDGRIIQDLDVGITIHHTRVGDLQVYLRSPDGTEIPLALNVGGAGDNFSDTLFDDEAGQAIASGVAPFTGRFRPASPLSVFDGKNAMGNWRLTVIDTAAGETGTVIEWSLHLTYAAYSCGVELKLQEVLPADTCSGTGEGTADTLLDPGEDITVQVLLLNNGSVPAEQVWGSLSSSSPWVTITRGTATFPDILPGAQGASYPGHFGFRVSPSAPCGETLELLLHFECYQDLGGWDVPLTFTVGQITPGTLSTVFEEAFSGVTWPGETGWVMEKLSGEGAYWKQEYTVACDAEYALLRLYSTAPTDTWAHTPGLVLSAGVPYTLSFTQWAESGITYGRNLSVWLGTAPDHSAMTDLLWSEENLLDSSCNTRTATIIVGTSGTYYIGFHTHSPGDLGYTRLYIDDILLTYWIPQACTVNSCTPCEAPGAPVIILITDPNPCSHGGVRISFTPGTGAVRHDLYMDGALVQSDVSSPVVHHSGDTVPHDYVVRAVWGSCHTSSEPVEGTDESSPTPIAPAPVATDWDTCDATSGLHVAWATVPDATSYDIEIDGSTVVNGVASPYIHVPSDAESHSFRVRAKTGNCAGAWSDATAAADEDHTPGTPSAPGVADIEPCAPTGVEITWASVPGAVTYELFVDGTTIASGVSSPYVWVPGNANSHSYQVRARSSDCKGAWSSATAGTDINGMAAPPAPAVTDLDSCVQSGVSVSWTPVPGAAAYDLILDGSDVFPDVTSPATHDPHDTANHDYSIRARAAGCTGDRSEATTKADQNKSVAVPATVRANDASPCAASGVTVTWDPVTGATGYDLSVDEKTVILNVTSPHTYVPGNADTHAYRIRAKNDSCTSAWSEADNRSDENAGVAVPTIIDVTDRDPCALTGVDIRWNPVSGSTAYDLLVDGSYEKTDVTSPATFEPGDGVSHTYQVRSRSAICTSDWSEGVACSDINNKPGTPVINSVVDIDPGLSTGIQVNYTAGAGATRHDLYRDGAPVKTDYTSGATYVPGDSGVHSYRVRAWKETCFSTSNSMPGTDLPQVPPPEIAPGDTSLTAQSWPDKTTHTWPSNASCALGYLLYRGTLADLPQLLTSSEESCLRFRGLADGENTVTGMTEDPSSIPGRFYWYLVTGINSLGEGTAGNATEGPRSMDSSGNCPAP